MKGFTQVYTGNGKGKTTAALGLSLRAAGAGLRVYIIQFLKKGDYSEIKALERFSGQIQVEQYGQGRFVRGRPAPEDVESARNGLNKAREVIQSGNHQLVVLEEANVAMSLGLIDSGELIELIDQKPDHVELVITGRDAPPELVDRADLVTEMKEVKHYYQKGVQARIGIEK